MTKPKITVYCISQKYGQYLEQAVESVLQQTTDNWELLLIDNASVDKTASVIEYYQNDSRVRTFRLQESKNLPSICNFAVEKANGDYLIRLDGDDFFDENILLILANWLDRNSEHDLVFPDYYLVTESGEVFSHQRREKITGKNHLLDVPANGACTMIRTETLRALGGYREDLGAQDGFDLWAKIFDHKKFANINLPLFFYRRHGKNMTERPSLIQDARRRIKLDAIEDQLEKFRPISLVIPCRENYDFRKDVWDASFTQSTLLRLCLSKFISSKLADHIIVACDNEAVRDILAEFEDERILFHLRQKEETFRSTPLAPSLTKALKKHDPDATGTALVTYCQTPFVSTATVEEALTTLAMNDVDSSMGVELVEDPIYKRDAHGLLRISQNSGFSSDFDQLYKETNCVLATRSRNLAKGSLLGSEKALFVVPSSEHFFIDSRQKLEIAEILASQDK